ncbi:MAG: hypothetical protein KAJ34_03685 [Thermodesulfovibrionia bacterium]|nr:hypothetical protein [Thermodesulfovibrionia bacterium]
MKKFLLLLFGVLFIISCGYTEGIIQKSDKSYLKFTGNWENVSVQIDDLEPFVLESYIAKSEDQERKVRPDKKLYQVSPGKHILKVYRDGSLIVDRLLILDNNVIKEVHIP